MAGENVIFPYRQENNGTCCLARCRDTENLKINKRQDYKFGMLARAQLC